MQAVVSFEPFAEAEVSGSAADLRRLAEVVRRGHGEVVAEVADPAPYEHAVRSIVVRTASEPTATVTIDPMGLVLELAGSERALDLLASNIEGLAGEDVPAGHHVHLEWCSDHVFLAEGSFPLVVTRAAG